LLFLQAGNDGLRHEMSLGHLPYAFCRQASGYFSGVSEFGIFAALAEFERELIRERTIAGLSSARARGRNGRRPYTMTPAKLRLAQAAMTDRDTKVGDLCTELGVTRQTLYRFVDPKGQLRADGAKLLKRKGQTVSS
jgi:hypothetical protein